jgi:hypothetical protein
MDADWLLLLLKALFASSPLLFSTIMATLRGSNED